MGDEEGRRPQGKRYEVDLHNKRKGTGFELGTIYFFFVLSCVFKIDILKNYYFWLF